MCTQYNTQIENKKYTGLNYTPKASTRSHKGNFEKNPTPVLTFNKIYTVYSKFN